MSITSATPSQISSDRTAHRVIRAGKKSIGIHKTYSGVPVGEPVALVGSSGLLEIAVRNGNAAKRLGLRVGHEVILA